MSSAKRRKIEENLENEEDTSDSWSDERFIETIQTVLGRFYYRSPERLQIKYKPPCFSDLERCSRIHWKNQDIPVATYSAESDCRMQKRDRKFSAFYQNINNICLLGTFPGPEILQLILQVVLDVGEQNRNSDEESPGYSIHMAIQQFELILINFPPCILQLEPSYSGLLIRNCNLEDIDGFTDGENGIIYCMVSTLEDVLRGPDETAKIAEVKPMKMTDTEDELRLLNETGGKGFDTLGKSAKIERIFVVLHLLIKLMEFDLAMWMLRHPKKASESMLKPTKQPLIGKVLWPGGDFAITLFIKKCFSVFVECIIQDLPEDQLFIFQRLIGLISNAVNLCEMQTTSEVQYPCIRQKSTNFAETFMQIITEYKDSSPGLTVKVIQHISSSITKMLMIDNFFSTINPPQSGNVSITKILKIFKGKDWIVQSKISQMEHVNLFVDIMKCWLDVYRLHDVFEAFSRGEVEKVPGDSRGKEKASIDERVAKIEEKNGRKLRVDYRAINRNLSKIVKKFKADIPIKYSELNLDYNVIGIANIYQLYLDEMKSVLKLHQLLVNRHKKYPSLFATWIELIEKHFGFALAK